MKKINETKKLLETYDDETLDICNDFIDRKLDSERDRGQAAEQRASIILGIVSAITAILVAGDVLKALNTSLSYNIVLYIAIVIWMIKAIWNAISATKNQNRKQLNIETIFEFKDQKSNRKTKIEIIAGKYWEYEQSIQPNTYKLFYVQRAQRALISAIFFLLLLALGIASSTVVNQFWSYYVCLIISLLAFIYFICGDYFFEKRTGWKFSKN